MKLCWVRLSRLKSSKVTFKQLIEILAPLIHRDQDTFLQVMRTNVRLFRSDGQLFTALKDSTQKAPTTAPDITDVPVVEKKSSVSSPSGDAEKAKGERHQPVSTPLAYLPVHTPGSATSGKRQKTVQSYNAITTNTLTASNPVVNLSSSSSSSSSMSVAKTPLRSSIKDRRRKSMEVNTPSQHVTPPVSMAQAIIEELLSLAANQWARLQATTNYYSDNYGGDDNNNSSNSHPTIDGDANCGLQVTHLTETVMKKSPPPFFLPSAPCHLTIAEIMLVVADLVAAVPGLATCVHR